MRSEAEIRENLEWLKGQCIHYKEDEAGRIVRHREILLWVLGHERAEAETLALETWRNARAARGNHPRDYGQ